MQSKPGMFFAAVIILNFGLSMGCHSGPSYRDDSGYRAIEREADRNSADLAITGSGIASGAERIDNHAGRLEAELDSLETAILDSALEDEEKGVLLLQIAAAQEETTALQFETGRLREDAGRLNEQLAEERTILTALSKEHDRRETAYAEVKEDLADTKKRLARVSGQRNLAAALAAVLAMAIIGYIAIRVLRRV